MDRPLLVALVVLGSGCGDDAPAPADNVPVYNGCTGSLYVDRSAPSANRTVSFGGANGSGPFAYSPPCITIAAGQTVTFEGSFNVHPLGPGTSPTVDPGAPNTPIPRLSSDAMPRVMVTFPAPGLYPYLCELHYMGGMNGVVRVR